MRIAFIAAVAGIVMALAARPARAHPHVFIDYGLEPKIENGAIVALRLTWRFDELYSALVVDSVDRDGNGKLSPPEIDAIARRTLKTAEMAKFYSYFMLDGVAWRADKAQHFTAEIDGDRVVYVFTLLLPAPAKAVTLSAYDLDYYIEMTADRRSAVRQGILECKISQAAPVKTQSWGSFQPDLISCGR